MPLDPEFVADCPYGPGGLLIDEILDIDRDKHFVRVRMPTTEELPLTREQRAHPVRHPRHISGGLMVHMTGMVGFVHAYYVLGLKHNDGWIGYGGRIYDAKFRALAKPGEPLILEGKVTQVRRSDASVFARYEFEFFQGKTLVYTGEQSAMWIKIATDVIASEPLETAS
jgi:3-hydroxymyristoyl/3-hydroxydecanoyl-(acyl carrier protein) dehydratase